jgi:hypothetical protein
MVGLSELSWEDEQQQMQEKVQQLHKLERNNKINKPETLHARQQKDDKVVS